MREAIAGLLIVFGVIVGVFLLRGEKSTDDKCLMETPKTDTLYVLVPIPTYIFHHWKLDGKQFQSLTRKELNNLLRYGRIE